LLRFCNASGALALRSVFRLDVVKNDLAEDDLRATRFRSFKQHKVTYVRLAALCV
jgi:hypothetical protein